MASKNSSKIVVGLFVIVTALAANTWAGPDCKTIDTAQLHAMVVDNAYTLEGGRKKHFTIVDARTKEEFEQAHIFSAINVPENNFNASSRLLPENKEELLVVYGSDVVQSETSRKWADHAAAAGYGNVVIYSEGFHVWKEKKMPVALFGKGL